MAPHITPRRPERDRKLRGPLMLRSEQQQETTYDQRLLESLGHMDHDWKHADPGRVMRIQSEFVAGLDALSEMPKAVTVFGSARLGEGTPEYELAREVGKALTEAGYAVITGGGRVTELTAKPLLRTYFPELASLDQPLAGEYAIRRETALEVPFVAGYGVEVGLLIDVYATHPNAITQVNLGKRTHRNRPLSELGPMADVVTRTVLSRAGVLPEGAAPLKQRPPWNKM